ncbi:MAG: TonB-dependent receptor plug domain-containing protein, partial [Bacteroidales bacterium]|nr:TonB-dependent receptor plug domain-containing protein [Bacteroidales bacterium]
MLLRKTILMVCIMLVSAYASAQNITITGNVSDNTGPVVGVTVVVRGTVSTATTDLDGKYSITAPSTATLTFSSLGYKTVEVPVNGRTRIDVIMEEEAFILEDLVVVGFGTQKKVNLTGAVSSVNVQEALTSRPIADVGRALQGSTPGLTVQVGSGEVGSEAILKIRGHVGSAAGSVSPLILLDNVEIPSIQLVNPDDIESISILKDAASASIYGSKAAFGVILITTKKGAKTETVSVNYSGNVSFQNMSKKFEMAGVDALHYTVEAAERIGTTTPVGAFWLIDRAGYNAAVAWDKKYGSTLDPYAPMVYGRDWYVDASNRKIGVRTYDPYNYLIKEWAPTQTHNLSVTG